MSGNLHHPFGPSSLERRDLCPASFRLEENLPSFDTENSVQGTKYHEEIAKIIKREDTSCDSLSCSDDVLTEMLNFFVEFYKAEFGDEETDVFVEHRLSFAYCGIEQYFGSADVIIKGKNKVAVIDWKTGYRFVERASDNLQLAAYALAAMQGFGIDNVVVVIFNPIIHQRSRAEFTDKSALASEIMSVINRCKADDAKCNPGENQCRYCKAAHYGTCPALKNELETALVKVESLPVLSSISADDLCELKRKCDIVAKLAAEVDSELKDRIERDGACGSWTLKESSGGREVIDIQEAFSLSGMDASRFLDCCTVSIAKLESAYAEDCVASGTAKTKKAAKEDLNIRLGSVIQMKTPRRVLTQRV